MRTIFVLFVLGMPLLALAQLNHSSSSPVVKTQNGILEGIYDSDIAVFRGIPFAQPPIGPLRWKEPQAVKNWDGIRKAIQFGPRAMQRPLFSDMNFRSDGMSEDCLYLNVWTPAKSDTQRLPVLVYFYGGGLFTGDGSEYRYDGENLARKGIVTLTVNYRLNVFGFLSHPELTKESKHKASGNYGFLDQLAALKWIQDNIEAFGGDPTKVTIAGESAGSVSVSAQMISPLSKELIAGAIGSSGSLMGTLGAIPLKEGEAVGLEFAKIMGANSIAALRKKSADEILTATNEMELTAFAPTIDGYFFPKSAFNLFTSGKQAKIPLLVGWNSQEGHYRSILGEDEPTVDNYKKALKKLYPKSFEEAFKAYPASTPEEVMQVASDLAGDRFTGYSSWKWADLHAKSSGEPVYRYFYAHPRPPLASEQNEESDKAQKMSQPKPIPHGAVHSAEIEYAMGNLATNKVYNWAPEDYLISGIMQEYYVNFVKTGNPNGLGVPNWPAINEGDTSYILHLDRLTRPIEEPYRERYLFLDPFYMK